MSMIMPFLMAWILGFAIAAPVGPIGLLCVRHSLTSGLKYGLAVGLGAALADCLYGALVGGGMTIISNLLLEKSLYIKLIGGFILLYLAWKEFKSKTPIVEKGAVDQNAVISLILITFLLTLTNPMTIMSFIGVFSANIGGIEGAFSSHHVSIIILGVFLGSMSWWFLLSIVASFSKDLLSQRVLAKIKYFSAAILAAFGIYSIISIAVS